MSFGITLVGQTIGNANTQSLFASTHMAGTGSSNPSMSFPFRHSDIPIATSLTGVSFPSSTGGGSTYFIRSGYILTSSMQTGNMLSGAFPSFSGFYQNHLFSLEDPILQEQMFSITVQISTLPCRLTLPVGGHFPNPNCRFSLR